MVLIFFILKVDISFSFSVISRYILSLQTQSVSIYARRYEGQTLSALGPGSSECQDPVETKEPVLPLCQET